MADEKALVIDATTHLESQIKSGDTVVVGSGIESTSGDLHLGVSGLTPRVRVNGTSGLLEWSSDGDAWDTMPTGVPGIYTGTAVLNFGTAYPPATRGSNTASVVVTGQTNITTNAKPQAWMAVSTTADHNDEEHKLVPINLTCGNIVAGTGFTIYANTEWRLDGTFNVFWCWQTDVAGTVGPAGPTGSAGSAGPTGPSGVSEWTITKETLHLPYAYVWHSWYSAPLPIPPTPGMYIYEVQFSLYQRMSVYPNYIYNAIASGKCGVLHKWNGEIRSWTGGGSTEAMWQEYKLVNNMNALTWVYDNNNEAPRIYAGNWLDSGLAVDIDTEFRFRLIGSTIQ